MKENIKVAIYTLLSILFFSITSYLIPYKFSSYINPLIDTNLLIRIFLIFFFSISIIIFIKVNKKYNSIIKLNIKEATLLMQFYKIFCNLEYKIRVNAKALIDNYIIKILTFKANNLDAFLYDEMDGFYNFLYKIKPKNNTELKYMDNGLQITREIEEMKNNYIFLNNNKMNSFEKIFLYSTGILSIILINLLLSLNFEIIIFKVMTSTVILYIMWYLNSLDNLTINTNLFKFEIYEKVLEQLSLLRYYPEHYENEYQIPKEIKKYRLGTLNLETKEITIKQIESEENA
ncbi:hypothetical protein HOC99_01825 [Candidatus Woesearchaeota archaeon]|jgi:hypothetical protein|nr:hypothetical protein [Candidatus Woesearchaeota archaeon]MBT4387829.1 hypothetical protein [Candidatus Woesearchaeota archaeon]MBT4595648.1 hypothetical protein [Candidatus Woesearchaeota archaeon]MBT5740869.1 hypothetical protein [Candidatus Woesearchaeota archaeon]MBT7296313.1 hypothetical protein [Candidatus Woesearchaeota archaeon]